MPMVFAASCMPWPTDMAAAETVCAQRKPRLSLPGLPLPEDPQDREHHAGSRGRSRPAARATIGMMTFSHDAAPTARRRRRDSRVAPTRPPNSACEDDDGQAEVPGDQVPGDRAEHAGEDHAEAGHAGAAG